MNVSAQNNLSPVLSSDESSNDKPRLQVKESGAADAVFKLPQDVLGGRKAPEQDTVLEAVQKEEQRTDKVSRDFESNLRQRQVRKQAAHKATIANNKSAPTQKTEQTQSNNKIVEQKPDLVDTEGEKITQANGKGEARNVDHDKLNQSHSKSKVADNQVLNLDSGLLGTKSAMPIADMSLATAQMPVNRPSSQEKGPSSLPSQSVALPRSLDHGGIQLGNSSTADNNNQQQESSRDQRQQSALPSSVNNTSDDQLAGASGEAGKIILDKASFNLTAATNSSQSATSGSPTSAQAEVVSGIMKQIEQLRQSGRTTMQINMPLPDGQNVKLYLRISGDRVQVKVDAPNEEISEEINRRWPDLTEEASKKGIRLESPLFGGEDAPQTDREGQLEQFA